MKALAFALLALCGGCFGSLVADPCAAGFTLHEGVCLDVTHDAGPRPDGAPVDTLPPGDAPVCSLDTTSDPMNCGVCGNVCASGVCVDSLCVGAIPGQIIAIGHDYSTYNDAMARVLGNAVALGVRPDLGVARWHGTASAAALAGTTNAITETLAQLGRPWHRVTLPLVPVATAFDDIDTLVVDAQLGNAAANEADGVAWASVIDAFLARGGVIVVLEGSASTSYRFARGADLYSTVPIDATGELAYVTSPTDAVTQQVLSPFLAGSTSVTLPGAGAAPITTSTGQPLVVHLTR